MKKFYGNHWIYRENEFGINQNIINTYFNTNKCLKDGLSYIKFDVKVSYDGVDEFGPQSYLYDLIITYRKGCVLYEDIWHREYWCHGDDDDPYVIQKAYPCN